MDPKKPIKRNKFTKDEDAILKSYINQYGESNWRFIRSHLPNRTIRQCRERWKYFLSPNTGEIKKKWTSHEDELLVQKYNIYGSKWSKICSFFHGRTDISLKNRFNLLKRNHMIYYPNSSSDEVRYADPNNGDINDYDNDYEPSSGKRDPQTCNHRENEAKFLSYNEQKNSENSSNSSDLTDEYSSLKNLFRKTRGNVELPCPLSFLSY